MRLRESMSWDVRVAVAVLLAWLAWALVWFVWAARDAGLRAADAPTGPWGGRGRARRVVRGQIL